MAEEHTTDIIFASFGDQNEYHQSFSWKLKFDICKWWDLENAEVTSFSLQLTWRLLLHQLYMKRRKLKSEWRKNTDQDDWKENPRLAELSRMKIDIIVTRIEAKHTKLAGWKCINNSSWYTNLVIQSLAHIQNTSIEQLKGPFQPLPWFCLHLHMIS